MVNMQLKMQSYAPLDTMQTSIFGGNLLFLLYPPNLSESIFSMCITLNLLVWSSLHCLLSLNIFPVTYEMFAILSLMPYIVTHLTYYVTKELRNRLVSFSYLISTPFLCPAFNSRMAKTIAWEIITIKETTILDQWWTSWWKWSSLHACIRFLLLWLLPLLRGLSFFTIAIFYHMFTFLTIIAFYSP